MQKECKIHIMQKEPNISTMFTSSIRRRKSHQKLQQKEPKQKTISHFPIEQRTGFSRLFGGTKNKQYAEYGI
jgi:hypothetical protein